MYVDRYGDDADAPALLVLLWEATIASGEPQPADDVAELRWFPRSALPPPEEIAFHALPSVLRAWAASAS
jgi:hypothetical protein